MTKATRTPDYVQKMPEYAVVREAAERATVAARAATEVTDEATCARAAEVLTVVAKAVKVADKKRLEATEPYRNSTKVIDAEFKELAAPLKGVEERLRGEIVRFEAERRRAAEEEVRKHEAEVRAAEKAQREAEFEAARAAEEAAKRNEPPPPAPAPPPPPPPPPAPREKSVRHTSTGSVSTRTVWKFEIVDSSMIPREYLSVDGTAIRTAISVGVREIKGLRIYPDEQAHVR